MKPYDEAVVTEENGVLGVRVVARETGFFQGHRVKTDAEFFMPLSLMQRDPHPDEDACEDRDYVTVLESPGNGTWILPRWVLPAGQHSRAEIKDAADAHAQKMIAAAIASSGRGHKKDSFIAAMRGDKPLLRAAQAAVDSSAGPASEAKQKKLRAAAAQADIPDIDPDTAVMRAEKSARRIAIQVAAQAKARKPLV